MGSFADFLANLQTAQGRLSRSLFFRDTTILGLLIVAAAAIVAGAGRLILGTALIQAYFAAFFLFSFLSLPWAILLTVKRFHDFGLSGWWFLVVMLADGALGILTHEAREAHVEVIILVGLIDLAILLAICLWPGTPGDNRFGPPGGTTAGTGPL